ncbi:uncharacterized protein BO66DRAFT_37762 [Aspergillus aculeatinus CBS 121060]|uniref:Uncharacterized protein n=1 Tax=Aspergillus aculeatinus CBS 121060 TaxID=1448322 RepID=A0ACD1HEZ9_9EURO|nr:hypothetical protein BO66DRAFT_37762 [Aspergillus aculeatinus CBS 121060]RAH72094.1 hypothetical protein BO66DRAFT_37762 [Aspergillus aculeatinus CBS 121060]
MAFCFLLGAMRGPLDLQLLASHPGRSLLCFVIPDWLWGWDTGLDWGVIELVLGNFFGGFVVERKPEEWRKSGRRDPGGDVIRLYVVDLVLFFPEGGRGSPLSHLNDINSLAQFWSLSFSFLCCGYGYQLKIVVLNALVFVVVDGGGQSSPHLGTV